MNKTKVELQKEFLDLDAQIEVIEHSLFDPVTPDAEHDKLSLEYKKLNAERMSKVKELQRLEIATSHI